MILIIETCIFFNTLDHVIIIIKNQRTRIYKDKGGGVVDNYLGLDKNDQ